MRALRITLRVLLGILGGYALSAATSAALALALHRLGGIDRAESTLLCGMFGVAFYLAVLLWTLTTPALGRAAGLSLGGCLLACVVVRWLSASPATALSSLLMPLVVGG
jgi:hypothetical protein